MSKKLTWDKLADIYGKKTGRKARTMPMDSVFEWAKNRKDLFKIDEEGYLYLIESEEE